MKLYEQNMNDLMRSLQPNEGFKVYSVCEWRYGELSLDELEIWRDGLYFRFDIKHGNSVEYRIYKKHSTFFSSYEEAADELNRRKQQKADQNLLNLLN